MFESEISLMVYPPETIFAEKLETVISKGAINSRMKDYHDLFLLAHNPYLIDLSKLKTSIFATFQHRGTALTLIEFNKSDFKSLDKLWVAHLKNLAGAERTLNLPQKIQDVILEINKALKKLAI